MKKGDRSGVNEIVSLINELELEVKSNILISINVDKAPFIKKITNDKVINLTGESGSGKSYFSNKYIKNDNYIVIDTDVVFGDRPSGNKESLEIKELFKNRTKAALFNDFDNCYLEILDYFKDSGKTIVIDSAQFRNIKDINKLKGTVIVIRTSIDTCYQRCIKRYKQNNPNITPEEINKYSEKKKQIYQWYKKLNEFILKVHEL